ncbi:hypothetical protein [Nocardia cyriacigeorgica]|uniref:hypothetical protein n=1 Tax=Nocardia cyriacigeorgica TaxID=135487 RepID=UPI0015E37BE5|nr:hypothetical protein [Nocardia cyriacigeorgica]
MCVQCGGNDAGSRCEPVASSAGVSGAGQQRFGTEAVEWKPAEHRYSEMLGELARAIRADQQHRAASTAGGDLADAPAGADGVGEVAADHDDQNVGAGGDRSGG